MWYNLHNIKCTLFKDIIWLFFINVWCRITLSRCRTIPSPQNVPSCPLHSFFLYFLFRKTVACFLCKHNSFSYSRTAYNWNHRICILLYMAYFTHNKSIMFLSRLLHVSLICSFFLLLSSIPVYVFSTIWLHMHELKIDI